MIKQMALTKKRSGRGVRRVLIGLLGGYLMTGLGCTALQRRLLYFPRVEPPNLQDRVATTERLERWKNSSGENIGWKRVASGQLSQGEVLITHGNAGCALDRVEFVDALQSSAAFDVFVLEYPGYGDRPGAPSESAFFASAEKAFQALPKRAPVYLLGESLGTGVAAHLAGTHPSGVAGLLLFAPYNRLADVAQYHVRILPASWILRDRFESAADLEHYHGPVAIVVGEVDHVVPEKFGRRLYDSYSGPKRLWTIPKGSHETIHQQGAEFWNNVRAFWLANPVS